MHSGVLRWFYLAKPLIPRPVQIELRRMRARRILRGLGGAWLPADMEFDASFRWPTGKQAALLLTHDVETAAGQANIGRLRELEDQRGLKSCWNFVVKRYEPDVELIQLLIGRGHEVGVHGVYHDGKLFSSRATFTDRLDTMEKAAKLWGARGFRSPSLLYDRELLRELPFNWDSSMPAWDPFQPQPGGCKRAHPFLLNDHCVELPVTLWQDFTLFEELRLTDISIWRRQIDALHERGGLINVIVHPDYMQTADRLARYRELLDHVLGLPDMWLTLPSEIADWVRTSRPSGTIEP